MGLRPIDLDKRRDWMIKVFDSADGYDFFTVRDKSFPELTLYTVANWPTEYAADRVLASPLDQWAE